MLPAQNTEWGGGGRGGLGGGGGEGGGAGVAGGEAVYSTSYLFCKNVKGYRNRSVTLSINLLLTSLKEMSPYSNVLIKVTLNINLLVARCIQYDCKHRIYLKGYHECRCSINVNICVVICL